MTGLPRRASPELLGAEFNPFLFAHVWTEKTGRSLSVVSFLARLDLDPWEQAAGFAGLPGKVATQKLAMLLASQPDRGQTNETPDAAAARLIGLLPVKSGVKPAPASLWRSAVRKWRAVFAV